MGQRREQDRQVGLDVPYGWMIETRTATDRLKPARERILDTAYELFSLRGIRAVGVDEIVEQAGIAKATLYRHFASKDDLVLAYLDRVAGT